MLTMGRMCHCKSTIKKWNASGELVWRLRRGAPPSGTRADYAMYVDHAAALIYAGGSLVAAADEGVLYKYSAIDSEPDVDWKSDRNGFSEIALTAGALTNRPKVAFGTDGFITVLAPSTLQRYDPSTGELLATATVPALNTRVFPGPSGDVFIHNPNPITNGAIKRFNTSLVETHSYDSGGFIGFGDVVDIDGSSLAICQANKIAVFDNTFTQLRSLTNANNHRIVVRGNTAFVYASAPSFKRFDLSGISLTWTNTTMSLTTSGYSAPVPGPQNILMAADSSNRFYAVLEKTGAVSKIQQRSGTDGSVLWEADIGESKLENMRGLQINEAAGMVVAIGRWYHGAGSTDPRHIVALDMSDGSELWTAQHGDPTLTLSGFHDLSLDDDGNVYACGFDAS